LLLLDEPFGMLDSLTRWDNTLKLIPALATSWKNVNDTTWEFTLRPGVKFHDGAPLTAEDVKATLDRNLTVGKTVVSPGSTIEAVRSSIRRRCARHQEARSLVLVRLRWDRRSSPRGSPPMRA
jgi:hypothetical protein